MVLVGLHSSLSIISFVSLSARFSLVFFEDARYESLIRCLGSSSVIVLALPSHELMSPPNDKIGRCGYVDADSSNFSDLFTNLCFFSGVRREMDVGPYTDVFSWALLVLFIFGCHEEV